MEWNEITKHKASDYTDQRIVLSFVLVKTGIQ